MTTEVIKLNGKQLDADSIYIQSVFDKIYPVGSIYMSVNSASPSDLFGGTWERLTDRFLVGAGNSYGVNTTGGSTTHTHQYGMKFGGYYNEFVFAENANVGLLNYDGNNNISITGYSGDGSASLAMNSSTSSSTSTTTPNCYRMYANASYTNSTPPTSLCICGNVLRKKKIRRCLWQK